MNTFFLEELKEQSRNIKKEEEQLLADGIVKIIELSNTGRKLGLLGLQEYMENLPKEKEDGYLRMLLSIVIDGVAPSLVEEFGLMRYCVEDPEGASALLYLMYLKGVLMILNGENTIVIEQYLKAMVRPSIVALYES